MNEVIQQPATGAFLVSEANGSRSRETVTIIGGQDLAAGTVLGKITVGAAAVAAASGNTGNGTIGPVTTGANAKSGIYNVFCIEPAANGGVFEIEDPEGVLIGRATVGVAFTGEVNFTIADGANDFIAGDRFLITVSGGTNANKYRAYDPDSTDGSQIADALLYAPADTTAGFKDGIVVIARDAEFDIAEVVWKDTATTDLQKAAAISDLAKRGLIAR